MASQVVFDLGVALTKAEVMLRILQKTEAKGEVMQ